MHITLLFFFSKSKLVVTSELNHDIVFLIVPLEVFFILVIIVLVLLLWRSLLSFLLAIFFLFILIIVTLLAGTSRTVVRLFLACLCLAVREKQVIHFVQLAVEDLAG
jgi:hypothetical protein